jgi:hypothetical protein
MSKMTFTSPRATLEETLAFANAVREAGGGNPLDALMPAVPEDASQCLIAKNLNFNCQVDTWGGDWVMHLKDEALRDRIAEKLGLSIDNIVETEHYQADYMVVLPPEIGKVAEDFDNWELPLIWDEMTDDSGDYDEVASISPAATKDDIERFQEFWPYIDASMKEAFKNATFVNDRGEIVI